MSRSPSPNVRIPSPSLRVHYAPINKTASGRWPTARKLAALFFVRPGFDSGRMYFDRHQKPPHHVSDDYHSFVFSLPPLAPLAPKFSRHEGLTRRGNAEGIRNDLASSVAFATVAWLPILLRLQRFIARKFEFSTCETRSRKAILQAGSYNFGWPMSYRETWSSDNYERYFQQVDNDLYTKMLKEALLDGLIESLEKRNICTAGLAEATTRIFNDGIILTGGSVQAENLAVGSKATAASNRMPTGGTRT
jgi:hypothetical protein